MLLTIQLFVGGWLLSFEVKGSSQLVADEANGWGKWEVQIQGKEPKFYARAIALLQPISLPTL